MALPLQRPIGLKYLGKFCSSVRGSYGTPEYILLTTHDFFMHKQTEHATVLSTVQQHNDENISRATWMVALTLQFMLQTVTVY